MKNEFRDMLVELYNHDKYHIDFIQKVSQIIPDDLWDIYINVLNLSLDADTNEEVYESFQIAIEMLCKGLEFDFDKNGILYNKEV